MVRFVSCERKISYLGKSLYLCTMKKIGFLLFPVFLLIFMPSCKFQQTLKKGSVDEKYESALKYYNEKDYNRALQLFDQLVTVLRATDKAERVFYYYAYCYYHQKDYTLAAYYFKRYASNFPGTAYSEECLFMSAYCNYKNSPEYTLDQTVTYEAIKEFQLFVNLYPTSKRVSECNDLIDELRRKLEMKDYRIAKMYHRMEDYAASIQTLNGILKEFPESPHREEILYLIFKSYHRYAKESIESKKKERYNKSFLAYNDFVAQYPESGFLPELKTLKKKAEKELEELYTRDQTMMEQRKNKLE